MQLSSVDLRRHFLNQFPIVAIPPQPQIAAAGAQANLVADERVGPDPRLLCADHEPGVVSLRVVEANIAVDRSVGDNGVIPNELRPRVGLHGANAVVDAPLAAVASPTGHWLARRL